MITPIRSRDFPGFSLFWIYQRMLYSVRAAVDLPPLRWLAARMFSGYLQPCEPETGASLETGEMQPYSQPDPEQPGLGTAGRPLRVLLVREPAADASDVLSSLMEAGFRVRLQRAAVEREFLQAITPPPDVVISDYRLENFSVLRANELLQTLNLNVPVVLVAGQIGEERVAEVLKGGVDDYVYDERMEGLGKAVVRALRDRQLLLEQVQRNEALLEREDRFKTCIEQMLDGVCMLSAVRGHDWSICGFHIDYLNPVARRPVFFLGANEAGSTIRGEDTLYLASGMFDEWRLAVDTGLPTAREVLAQHSSGGRQWLQQAYDVRAVKMGDGLLVTWQDVTHKKQAEQELSYLSTHDTLTGLYNRAYFEAEVGRLQGSRLFPVSVLVADIEGLKSANEKIGYAGGDELLRRAAFLLVSAFRSEDMVARVGGDEFAVLLPRTGEEAAARALERVQSLLDEQNTDGSRWPLSISVGCSTAEPGSDLLQAYRAAEQRMNAAREARR